MLAQKIQHLVIYSTVILMANIKMKNAVFYILHLLEYMYFRQMRIVSTDKSQSIFTYFKEIITSAGFAPVERTGKTFWTVVSVIIKNGIGDVSASCQVDGDIANVVFTQFPHRESHRLKKTSAVKLVPNIVLKGYFVVEDKMLYMFLGCNNFCFIGLQNSIHWHISVTEIHQLHLMLQS